MIVTNQKIKIVKNNKNWKRGVINLKNSELRQLNNQEQEINLLILRKGEELSYSEFTKKIVELRTKNAIEEEMTKLKKDIFFHPNH